MSDADELKVCPFCGATQGYGDEDVQVMIESSYYMVGCGRCGCASINHVVRDEAIAAWNRRADTPQLDWDKAKAHLDFYEKEYNDLDGGAGRFALAITIMPLRDRLERGERTKWLYDEIMEVE